MEDVVNWGKKHLAQHGNLPGRCVIEKQFGVTSFKAREIGRQIRAALTRQIAEGVGVLVEEEENPQADAELVWKAQQEISKKVIRHTERTTYRKLHFEGSDPIVVCFPSDLHLGSPWTDHERIIEDQRLIAATPRCYQVNGGDVFDNAIKHKSHMMSATATPPREIRMLEHLLDIAGHRYPGVVSGNHDNWTMDFAGVDVLKGMFHRKDIIYAPWRLHLTLELGDAEYRIFVSHQGRWESSLNPLHAVQRILERGQDDFDIGVIGHKHETATGCFYWRKKRRGAIRPGSYQISSDYCAKGGYNDAIPSCLCAIFTQSEFYVFDDLRLGLKLFPALKPAKKTA